MLVSDKIKLLREQRGISRSELALLINYSQSFICKLENGTRTISEEILEIIKKALGCSGTPISDEEIVEFKKNLFSFYDSIKNGQLEEARKNANDLKVCVDNCFEDEFKILFYLFESYLILREFEYEKAQNQLEELKKIFPALNDEQSYYFNYFYAASVHKNFSKALKYFLKAEIIANKLNKKEANLYYSIANLYSRIDYAPKSIVYGKIALELAQSSMDKAYLIDIEATLAFEYSKIGCYQLALDGLNGCLVREKLYGDPIRLRSTYHNLGCVYLSMQYYENALNHFEKSFMFCITGDWFYLNNKLHIAYVYIKQNRKGDAQALIDECLPSAGEMPDMLLFFEAAKCSLCLDNTESLTYMENICIPELLKLGKHLKAIEYMNILSDFYASKGDLKQFFKKSAKYARLSALYMNKIYRRGDLSYEEIN